MISVYLMGGLGNQLFQIFTAFAQAIKYNIKIVFPYAEKLQVGITRPTYWGNFLNSISVFTTANRDTGVTNADLNDFQVFHESGFSYSEIPNIDKDRDIMLVGYFQSWRYFHKYRDQIMDVICIPILLEAIYKEFPHYFAKEKAHIVSMHFRLGDYKDKPDFHPIMPYEYYRNALDMCIKDLKTAESEVKVLYFCEADDNTYVTEIIDQIRKVYAVEFQKVDDTIPDWKQMLIMSNCDANIIANSTYSWWGAYLSSGNRVYYPHKWFGERLSHHCTDDLFLEDWSKIDF